LHSESEMVVMQSSGLSPFRLLRPYLYFGLLVSFLAAALSHYLVPISTVLLERRQQELAQDMASRMIVGGRFVHPADDVTFFVGRVDPNGGLEDIFLHDQRAASRDVTYTAHKAVLLTVENDVRLVMFDGLIQTLDRRTQRMAKIQFDEFVFDAGTLTGQSKTYKARLQDYSTRQLLFPTEKMLQNSNITAAAFVMEAHKRLEQPLQSLVYPLIGMAVLMLGGFSRFGVLRQILGAVGIVIAINAFAIVFRDAVRLNIDLWPLLYLPDICGFALVLYLLRPKIYKIRRRKPAFAGSGGAA